MKCLACHASLSEGEYTCSHCGYTPIVFLNAISEAEAAERREKHSASYRSDILDSISLSVEARQYVADGEHYRFDHYETVELLSGSKLKFGEIAWNGHPFARSKPDSHSEITLIMKKNGTSRKVTLNYPTPELNSLWFVGFELTDGLEVKAHIGTAACNSTTDNSLPLL